MFEIITTKIFLKQVETLSENSKSILKDKISLLKINPLRNKRLRGHSYFVYRIRFSDRRKEKRAIYSVEGKYVIMICILDRNKEYKDLRKFLKNLPQVHFSLSH